MNDEGSSATRNARASSAQPRPVLAATVINYATPGTPRVRPEPPRWVELVALGTAVVAMVMPYVFNERNDGGEGGAILVTASAFFYVLVRLYFRHDVRWFWKLQVLVSVFLWALSAAVVLNQSRGRLDYWRIYNQTYRYNYDQSIPWLWVFAIGVIWFASVELANWRDRGRRVQGPREPG